MPPPTLSLIVPTRGRANQLRRFLASVAATARRPDRIEVVLVIDSDDPESGVVDHPWLTVRRVVGPPGRTMGELNLAGFASSAGDFVMLLNDDVVVRTRGWDVTALRCVSRFPDTFILVHVNDTLIQHHLCVFPLVSRAFCELAGGICPSGYRRYRIDDHIEDVFNLLAAVGVRRTVYLPDVVFEHTNAIEHPTAGRVYQSDPIILAEDAAQFDALLPVRKELARRVLVAIGRGDRVAALGPILDSFAIRTEGRQFVVRTWWGRVRAQYRHHGVAGMIRAARRRLTAGRG